MSLQDSAHEHQTSSKLFAATPDISRDLLVCCSYKANTVSRGFLRFVFHGEEDTQQVRVKYAGSLQQYPRSSTKNIQPSIQNLITLCGVWKSFVQKGSVAPAFATARVKMSAQHLSSGSTVLTIHATRPTQVLLSSSSQISNRMWFLFLLVCAQSMAD